MGHMRTVRYPLDDPGMRYRICYHVCGLVMGRFGGARVIGVTHAAAAERIVSLADVAPGHPLGCGQTEIALEVAMHVDHAPLLAGEHQVGEAGLVHAAL
jgi:hypothetical protein